MAAAHPSELTLAELGEDGVLAAILPVLQQSSSASVLVGAGDDAAVVAAPDGRFVVSTDLLVEGYDFLRSTSSGRDVGAKAAAQNLADIAAMGARPTSLVVGLVVPAATPLSWVVDLARGLADTCGPAGAAVVGGDLSGGPCLMVSVAVHGDLQGKAPVLRSGARPGDVLALAGTVGRAAAGLDAFRAGGIGGAGAGAATTVAIATQRAARPPLAAGPRAALAGATAMIDVSDGLLRDAARIAVASGVTMAIDAEAAALAGLNAELAQVATDLGDDEPQLRAWQWVLTGGEDHGLLATFPTRADLPDDFAPIGRVTGTRLPSAGGEMHTSPVTVEGLSPEVRSRLRTPGWDHFGG